MSGGWSLTITTADAVSATSTSVSTSGTPSITGDPVTFTATVISAGNPVTSGSVQFSDGANPLGSRVAVNGSGAAALTMSSLSEGTHTIRATYGGTTGFLASNGSVTQRVDNVTQVTGSTLCNTGALAVPSVGLAQPYASNIFVTGLSGTVAKVTATLKGVSHQAPIDFDILLSAPEPTTNIILLSDAGGFNPASNVDLALDDEAANGVPDPLVSGTFKPTNVDQGPADIFPTPAPAPSSASTLTTFDGSDPNGTWSLWVVDDATGDSGSIAGGWCLTVDSTSPTTTMLVAAPNPSSHSESVALTATVTAGGVPVTTGAVEFRDGTVVLGVAVPIVADGTATMTISGLAIGTHTITANFTGTGLLEPSSASVDQVVGKVATSTVLTSDVNPAAVGQGVTFTATVDSSGSPVAVGTVTFSVDGVVVQTGAALDVGGQASYSTSTLGAGVHEILSEYNGTAENTVSRDTLQQMVNPVADASGPYTVVERGTLVLDGSGSTPGATYEWDVNGTVISPMPSASPRLSPG